MPSISLDLTGKWEFMEYPLSARKMSDLEAGDWFESEVPSSIFSSLVAAGQIKQSEIESNPEKFSYISDRPWIYKKTFDVDSDMVGCDRVDLVFDGLDTISSIWVNDKLIAKTNNMFTGFRFDVQSF